MRLRRGQIIRVMAILSVFVFRRLAKVTANPFSDGEDMKLYHHPACLFDTFKRVKAKTKIIEEPGDIEGFHQVWTDYLFFL